MQWSNGYKTKLVVFGCIIAVTLGRGRPANADFIFDTPTNLGPPIWSQGHDPQGCCFSHDGLELYFSSTRPGGYGDWDIWVATRETVDAPWGEPMNLGPNVNSPAQEVTPAISPDGLELYFTWYHDYNIRVCKRSSKNDPWSNPEVLGPPIGGHQVRYPKVSADGLSIYFASRRPGGYGGEDIWVSTRATTSDPWSEPANLGPNVNSSYNEVGTSMSSDGLCLFFDSNRTDGYAECDIWLTTRPTTDAEWGPPVSYPNLNIFDRSPDWVAAIQNFAPALSPDGSVLYFDTPLAVWQSSITAIVDLNSDGIVDVLDMCIMVDHWGEDYSLCDIGPMPWGDGVVDVEDLKVLAGHLFEEVDDPTLMAHWPLDEAQGVIAYNDASDRDGTLTNGPVWQPEGGMVAGALQLDGVDDYVETDPVLNPEDGMFSVLAWIQGGAPGQVIVSQALAANWLTLDTEGKLTVELQSSGRNAGGPLLSEAVITDGNWHRIGFVWDGSYRHLHVDGVEVAADVEPLNALKGAGGGLYLGAGSDLAPGTFFSGLIDEVRIYNRVVSP